MLARLRSLRTSLVVTTLVAVAACSNTRTSGPTPPDGENFPPLTEADRAFAADLEERTFRWFWDTANPENGLVPDRWPTPSFSSIAAVGFGLTAYPIGAENGWITRQQAAERTLVTLRFFWQAPQTADSAGSTGHRGFFYHFLDMQTGRRFGNVELSTIDTALLLAGVLFGQQYFDQPDTTEAAIRAYADSLYERVDWTWIQPRAPYVSMGWHPESGFIQADLQGYNEAMLLYILAFASPTHAIDPGAWDAWTSTYRWAAWYGYDHVNFAPLFGHQYSHVWIDFRGIQDDYMRARGIDYFENSRRATLAQRGYAIVNPNDWNGYGADFWGLTASDGPLDTTIVVEGRERRFFTYRARGTAFGEVVDDGTIVPTAAGGSIPFAPEATIPMLRGMRERFGSHLYGQYGFLDAVNLTYPAGARVAQGSHTPVGWVDGDYLGIDQGPIVAMIENWRTGLVWDRMRRSPYIRLGLERAGFTGGWLGQ